MRIIYEADDGMQFNTAEECGHYEYKSSILLDQEKFLCFDEMLHPIKLCKGYNFAEVIANTYFFICFTKEAVERISMPSIYTDVTIENVQEFSLPFRK